MTPRSLLLCVLVLQSLLSAAWSSPTCNNQCCRFVEGFPVRLRRLRLDYSQIREFYVSKSRRPAGNYYDRKCILSACAPLWSVTRRAGAFLQTLPLTRSFSCRRPMMTWTRRCWTRAWRTRSRYVHLQTFFFLLFSSSSMGS